MSIEKAVVGQNNMLVELKGFRNKYIDWLSLWTQYTERNDWVLVRQYSSVLHIGYFLFVTSTWYDVCTTHFMSTRYE